MHSVGMCEFDCMYVQVDDIIARNDTGNDRVTGVSYEVFLPWFRRVAQKHWRATHSTVVMTYSVHFA